MGAPTASRATSTELFLTSRGRRRMDFSGLVDLGERGRIADGHSEGGRRSNGRYATRDIGNGLRCGGRGGRRLAFLGTTRRLVHRDEEVIPLLAHVNCGSSRAGYDTCRAKVKAKTWAGDYRCGPAGTVAGAGV